MNPKTQLKIIWFRLGESLQHVAPAPALWDDMADLTDYIRGLFRNAPEVLDATIELEGFAPVEFRFRALCQTVAMLAFVPHTAATKLPDAVCLLVNGLEGAEDIATVRAKVKFPAAAWEALDGAPKPVVLAVFNVNGRLRDPATTTVLRVIANVYFNTFGTNDVSEAAIPG